MYRAKRLALNEVVSTRAAQTSLSLCPEQFDPSFDHSAPTSVSEKSLKLVYKRRSFSFLPLDSQSVSQVEII
ncbi:hypothetical protein VFPPC_17353 [Pochonia chlamydosporia 170]|uniref:Uncharacterized protein n=1 Tax=Pochonia chlamydosporia 170 TaxID=1380566 RepID=A0A219ARU2_METCM|nr:hypothetical protein VFPPC_17353 [Pochonia chlamydosporia 170]OWT43498.1 hypothetical protein VFPPC_17353 [Pochonia chlamydosporia 170]